MSVYYAHKFYDAEGQRWPELLGLYITDRWAVTAVEALARLFKVDKMRDRQKLQAPVMLSFCEGSVSWGSAHGIVLARDRDWLVLAHEFAHVWEYRKHGESQHRKRLAGYVDQVARTIVDNGWHTLDLSQQFDAYCQRTPIAPNPPLVAWRHTPAARSINDP